MFKAYVFYGRELDFDCVHDRFKKLTWRIFRLCYRAGVTPEIVMELNQEKLRARYPEKFSAVHANKRDLEAERQLFVGAETKKLD
jgi:hypothetical protein